MRIGGLQKLTLLDFPGHVACTVFLQGCNFRCPFCHNSSLVLGTEAISEDEVFRFLNTRQGLLDGVAITGGEPLLSADLPDFLRKVKALGYQTKVDTNGSFPEKLRSLIDEGLVDYVAMDVKNSPEKYAETAGAESVLDAVRQSVDILMKGAVPCEFRTTVVDELHEPSDFEAIGRWLSGAQRYFLQGFVDSGDILRPGLHAASKEKMKQCLEAVIPYLPTSQIRGL
ncbi:MAG: anaerobic ribonucleoside-triphosphate reductase activating protein [Clostridia bacterium]|nr:anaerobic ribonucleoside-triphosphate reductase activating protein [Oscillospiraceae bacterium]MBQ3763254.1 anaerobic ribonucleoside-triphosphate reductase activating protein [Clostridia bacterium]